MNIFIFACDILVEKVKKNRNQKKEQEMDI